MEGKELPEFNIAALVERLKAGRERAQLGAEPDVVDKAEPSTEILTLIREMFENNTTGAAAANAMETLEYFRHNRYLKLLLDQIKAPDRIIAENDAKIRGELRKRAKDDFDIVRPIWYNMTPDALIMKDGKVCILEVAVSRNKSMVKRTKKEKYAQMARDLGLELIVMVQDADGELKGFNGEIMEDEFYNAIIETIRQVDEIIDTNQLRNAYERKRKTLKPIRERDISIPTEFTILKPAKIATVDETELMDDIAEKAKSEPMFVKTSAKEISAGYDDARQKIVETCNVENPRNNSLNFMFSTSKFGEGEKEKDQVERFLKVMRSSKSKELNELAKLVAQGQSGELTAVTRRNCKHAAKWMHMAKVKGFWDRDEENEAKMHEMMVDENKRKQRSWDPLNWSHIQKAEAIGRKLEKFDEGYTSRFPIRIEEDETDSEVLKASKEFGNSVLENCQNTVGLAMCRFCSSMAQKSIHQPGVMKRRVELWTGGFSANAFLKLPCDQPRGGKTTVPYISLALTKSDEDLVDMCDTMMRETIMLDGELVTLHLGFPQRMFMRQMEQWINADLEAINLIALHSRSTEDGRHEFDRFPIGHVTMFCLNQHLSLSYLLESLKNVGQSALSDYSQIREFIKDKLGSALKSPYELFLWRSSLTWSMMLNKMKPKGKNVIIRDGENDAILRSSAIGMKFPSLFAVGKDYDLADMLNQISAPFMMRKKNQHDPIQGLSILYGDLTKLQLDWHGDKNINVKEMTKDSKFTYDKRYIVASTLKAEADYYMDNANQIRVNMQESGMFDSHGLLATNRGSRKPKPDQDGFLVASTNIEESLLNEDKPRVIDVAKEALDEEVVFEFAQKEQKGKDRAIGVTTFGYRCMLKCCEDIAKSHSKLLPNEAMNKSGELKIKIAQNKIAGLVKGRIDDIERGRATLLMVSADNAKHSEHDATQKYEDSWELHRHLDNSERGLVIKTLRQMRKRKIYLPRRIWRQFKKMCKQPFKEHVDIAKFWDMVNGKAMPGGWVQGMFNNISTKLHAEAQAFAIEVMKYVLKRNIQMVGDVHSDDSWFAILIELLEGDNAEELHQMAINVYYWCMQAAGFRLNLKKTIASTNIMEFLSRFYIPGDQVSTYVKSGISIISPLPYRGPGIDMPSAVGKIMQYMRDGGWLCMSSLMCALVTEQVNRLYSMGKGQINDPQLGNECRRHMMPLGHGGSFNSGPLSLMMWGPKVHNLNLLYRYDQMNDDEKKMFNSALPTIEGDIAIVKDAIGRQIDGGWVGPVNNPHEKKSIEKVRKRFNITDVEKAREIIRDHPVLRFDKPRTHNLLMMFLRALITDPDFAMGMQVDSSMDTYIRIAKAVRAPVWRVVKTYIDENGDPQAFDDKVTLAEWYRLARQKEENMELIRSLKRCYDNSGGRLMMMQEMSLRFVGQSVSERIPHMLKVIKPVPGERTITENIGSLLMYKYDITLYKEDKRVNHLRPEWDSQMALVNEIDEMMPENIPKDQKIGLVYSILNQDKMYSIYASLPHFKTNSPTELIRVMFTHSFFPNMVCDVDFTGIPARDYLSPTFKIHLRSDIRRACAAVIGLFKWFICSQMEERYFDILRNAEYITDDGPLYLDDIIDEGLRSGATTRPMKDDLLIVRNYLDYGIDVPFINMDVEERFSEVKANIIDVEYRQDRVKGGWSGYGRISVSMKPNLYTALEFIGVMRNTGKDFKSGEIEASRIVSNHKNEMAVNMAIQLFQKYLGNMSQIDFMKTFRSDGCRDGLKLIGEVYHRRVVDEGEGMIVWSYDPNERSINKTEKIIQFRVNDNMDLIGEYPDARNPEKMRKITVRRSWTWLHIPTQGSVNWVDENGEDVKEIYGELKLNLNCIEKRKGVHTLAGNTVANFQDILSCVELREDMLNPVDLIRTRFGANIREMEEKLRDGRETDTKILGLAMMDVEDDDTVFEEKLKMLMESNPTDVSLYTRDLKNKEMEIDVDEEETDLSRGTMLVIRFVGGQSLTYSFPMSIKMMMAHSLSIYRKEDVIPYWPFITMIIGWMRLKEDEVVDNNWRVSRESTIEWTKIVKRLVLLVECCTAFVNNEVPTIDDYKEEIANNSVVDKVNELLGEGRLDAAGSYMLDILSKRNDLLGGNMHITLRIMIDHYLRIKRTSRTMKISMDI